MGGWWSIPRFGRFTTGKETLYPLYRRRGGPQGRSRRLWEFSLPPGFDPRTVQPRSELLYRPSYRGPRAAWIYRYKGIVNGNNEVHTVNLIWILIWYFSYRYVKHVFIWHEFLVSFCHVSPTLNNGQGWVVIDGSCTSCYIPCHDGMCRPDFVSNLRFVIPCIFSHSNNKH